MLSLWIYLFEILSGNKGWQLDIVWVVGRCVIIFMFVITSSLITEAFEDFERLLIDYGKEYLEKTDDDKWYNYMIAYTTRYPFKIQFGQVSITKVNTATFLIGFVIARFVAFSVVFLPTDSSFWNTQ